MHQPTSSNIKLYLPFYHLVSTLRFLQNYPELLVLFKKAVSPHFVDSLNQTSMCLKAESSATICVGFHWCINQESQPVPFLVSFPPPNLLFKHARTLHFVPQHLKAFDENLLKILLENPVECINMIFPSKESIDSFKENLNFKNNSLCKHNICVLLSKSYVSIFIGSVLYYNNHIYICSLVLFFIITTTNLLNADVKFTKIYTSSTPPLSLFFSDSVIFFS